MGPRVARVGMLVSGAVLAVLGVLLLPAPAAAHNSLTGSDPRDGARLDKAPTSVRLAFLSRLDPETTRVTVTGPDNVPVAAGKPSFARSHVTVPVRPGAAGLYTVRYEVASGDGHPIRGTIRFTLTEAAVPSPSATTAVASTPTDLTTSSASPVVPSAPVVAGPPTPAADSHGTTWWPWLVGAGVALAALAGGLLLRRRTSARSAGGD